MLAIEKRLFPSPGPLAVQLRWHRRIAYFLIAASIWVLLNTGGGGNSDNPPPAWGSSQSQASNWGNSNDRTANQSAYSSK